MTDGVGTILVMDDQPEMRALLRGVLQEPGHQVTVSQSGREAFKHLTEAETLVM
ncbi:MAG: hypothetical protein ACREIK_05430 [Nitrospiraceae bacterium]